MQVNLGLEKHVVRIDNARLVYACHFSKMMLELCMLYPSTAQIPSVPAQSSTRIPFQSYTKNRKHIIVIVIQSYTIQYPSRSLPSRATTCAWSTITQTDNLIIHIIQAQRASRGNALAARCSHDDRPCRVQQLEELRSRSYPRRRTEIQTGVHDHGGDDIAVTC